MGSNSGSFSSRLALISTLVKGNGIQFWLIEIQVEGGSLCVMSSFLTYRLMGWLVLFGTKWHMQTYKHTCTLYFLSFSISFHVSIQCISVYKIFPFCTDTLLLISYSHFPLYLLIHNVGLDINVKILQLNWRHLGLLHLNAITSSAAIRPLFFILSPILCHSPLCLYLFPPPYKSPSRLYTVVI